MQIYFFKNRWIPFFANFVNYDAQNYISKVWYFGLNYFYSYRRFNEIGQERKIIFPIKSAFTISVVAMNIFLQGPLSLFIKKKFVIFTIFWIVVTIIKAFFFFKLVLKIVYFFFSAFFCCTNFKLNFSFTLRRVLLLKYNFVKVLNKNNTANTTIRHTWNFKFSKNIFLNIYEVLPSLSIVPHTNDTVLYKKCKIYKYGP